MASTANRIVGREQELLRIGHALDWLAEAGAWLVEISGEAGIGKTRLLDELCSEGEARGYLVLRGHAAEFERGFPFAPVMDAFDAYLATVDPELLGADDELRDELGAIFPSLRRDRRQTGVQDERHRLWRAVRELLGRLASEQQGHLLVPLQLARVFPLEVLGRLGEAVALGEDALEAARTSPNPQYLFWALWECAYAHTLAGDLERALVLFEECVHASEGLARNFLSWPQPGATYGAAQIQAGEYARGVEAVVEGFGGPDAPIQAAFERPLAWLVVVDGLLADGRTDEAAPYVERIERAAEELDLELPRAVAAQARAALLLADGHAAEALPVASAGHAVASGRGLRFDAAHLRRLEGQALLELGRRGEAVKALREAEREFQEIPSVRARDAVRRELRRIGVRAGPRRAAPGAGDGEGLDSLSAREREIAELVTDRKTNREIAAELFLSEKTIETHLRNVFFKLGVSSRVDVARAIERGRATT